MNFSVRVTRLIICLGLILCPLKSDNHLHERLLFNYILLCHMYVGYTNIYFCERLSFNTFSLTFMHFNIVVLSWYDFAPYYILLPMSISALVF